MTEFKQELFDVLKASLWVEDVHPHHISDAVRAELRAQTVEGLTAAAYPDGSNLKYQQAARFTWMAKAQQEALTALSDAAIAAVVIKGTAAGMYYPQPYLRTYGDIDLLVDPRDYASAIHALVESGWQQSGEVGDYHTAFYKGSWLLELHQMANGAEDGFAQDYLRSGLNDIQTGTIAQPACSFPVLPWKQNGLELIWHFRTHLYNGIGLRHVIDWMMFVHKCLRTDDQFQEFSPILEQAGLLTLAKTVARMCQLYLGLSEDIAWCRNVSDDLCHELMDFILEQGNFGHKKTDDKAAKVLTRYRTPGAFLRGMQVKGIHDWQAAKKHRILRPFAWVYTGVAGIRQYVRTGAVAADRSAARQRRAMFDRLYQVKHAPLVRRVYERILHASVSRSKWERR